MPGKQTPARKAKQPKSERGNAGNGKPYDIMVRYSALCMIIAGQAPAQIADELGVAYQTVYLWKKNLRKEIEKLSEENRHQIELNLFKTILKSQAAIQAQLDVFTDKEWLRKQSATELAVLHGVLHDKSIRLLEGLSQDPSQASAEADQ